jgi:glycosyltransferase 2 family protein
LRTIGVNPTVINTSFAVFIGYFVNLGVPRAGEVAKCTVLAKYEKVPPHIMVGTILAERAWDIVCLILIWILAISLQASVIGGYIMSFAGRFKKYVGLHQAFFLIALGLLVVAIVALILVYRRHRENKIGVFLKEMGMGVFSILRMKDRWAFLGYSFLIWLMYTLQIYVGFLGLPALSEYHLTMSAALVVLVYGSIGVIITPGGIGMYTLLVAEILSAYSVTEVPAQAFGWIAWAVQSVIVVVLGIFSFSFIQLYNRRLNGQATLDQQKDI